MMFTHTHTQKTSSSFHPPPPLLNTWCFGFSVFCRLFSKLLDLHLHDQRIARHHRLTKLHLFLEEKTTKKKNIVGYTSRTSWACVCLVGCDWCKCKKNTHHLYSFLVLIFHYLVETNAEVIFCCAVSLCLDADYLRRFRMFTSWRRPAKGGQGTPSMPAKSTWSPGCIQTTPANCAKAFVVWSKPITILKPNI